MSDDKYTISEQLEDIKSKFCEDYCRFRTEYESQYKDPMEAYYVMLREKCENCPMARLT